jgi:myo-inositol-1(or 4)-monophosphatase
MDTDSDTTRNTTDTAAIDTDAVLAAVRDVGDGLLQQFPSAVPEPQLDGAMAAFERLNGPATEALRAALTALVPGSAWADDELDDRELRGGNGGPGFTWVCDAVDGAVQFLQAIPAWCVSVALLHEGRAVLAVVHDAVHGEAFHAVAGGGAFVNGVPLRASAKTELHAALAVHGNQPAPREQAVAALAGQSFSAVYPQVMAVRNLGPTALQLAYLAAGRVDAFWQVGSDHYNWLAGVLLATEAGAVATDLSGAAYDLRAESLLVAAPALHAGLLALLAPIGR